MFSGAGAGSRKKIPGAGAASKQDGSETLQFVFGIQICFRKTDPDPGSLIKCFIALKLFVNYKRSLIDWNILHGTDISCSRLVKRGYS